MRRVWAIASVLSGVGFLAYAGVAFAVDLGGPDAAEALGAPALLLGAFLLIEGSLSLRRHSKLRPAAPRENP